VNDAIELIPVYRLALVFAPVAVVLLVFWRWSLGVGNAAYANARMLVQLLLIGFVLEYLFTTDRPTVVLAVLAFMLLVAAWIALKPLAGHGLQLYLRALAAIVIGGVLTLVLVTQGVLLADPWYAPRVLIPLGGMIFANAMNAVSLGAERFAYESAAGKAYAAARATAFRGAMIPQVNTLFAVGLVSLPGMMTGQVLSGVSPLLAVRYQVMVMAMVFGSAGIATAIYLVLSRPRAG
jgi:putative ABC transport system permease protein